MKLRSRRHTIRRSIATVATLAAGTVVIAAAILAMPETAETRALSHCHPSAQVPNVSYPSGQAWAIVDPCGSGWNYSIHLKNRAGDTLGGGPDSGYASAYGGNTYIYGAWLGCAGAYVHTFFYMNVGGTGKSDTSGENSNCAY